MRRELPSVSQQLEALLHEWRNFPHLRAAVNSTRQILEHPEDYVRQDRYFLKDVIPLTEETQYGRNPLAAMTYLYDISASQETPASRQKAFLQVHFKLCSSIGTPRPDDFEPHISIIYAPVDDKGEILLMTVKQWELKVKKGITGRAKIVLACPKMLIKDTRSKLQTEIDQLTSSIPTPEPYQTTYYDWVGIKVNILPKSPLKLSVWG